ncbi:MAG TPA: fibronectin type III domain-containing protein [Chloroflexota bacterium]|nr:fibronectin type III domain-containing protein [Chloroflexota bacterium]
MRRGVQRAALAMAAACAVGGVPAARPAGAALAQACQVELTVDQPTEGAEVSARQRIAGWAVDRAAASGTGIEAVRVALDPAPDGGDDQLYMPLVYGVPRADVAYTLGNPRFAISGFAQDWAAVGTPPGRHRLVVQAKSACGWTSVTRNVRISATPPSADTIQEVPVRLPADDLLPLPTVPSSGLAAGTSPLDRTPPVPLALTRPHFALNANATGPTSVTLSWDAAPGAVRYNVYAADEATADQAAPGPAAATRTLGVSGLRRVQSDVTDTSTTLANLNSGDPYRFTVRAVGESGTEIGASDVARVTLPPGGSTTLTANVTNDSVALSWAAVPNAVSYAVQASAADGPLVPDPDRTSLTGTSVSVDHLSPGTYTFQIAARDAAGGRIAQSNRVQAVVDGAGGAVSTLLSAANAGAPTVAGPGMGASAGPPLPGVPPGVGPGMGGPPAVGPGMGLPPPPGGMAPPAGLAVPPAAGPGGVPPAAAGPGGVLPAAAGTPGGAGVGFPLNLSRTGADSVRLEWPVLPGAVSYAVFQAQGSTPLAFAYNTDRPYTTLSGLTNPAGYTFQVHARNLNDQDLATSVTVTIPPSQ